MGAYWTADHVLMLHDMHYRLRNTELLMQYDCAIDFTA
jgi:hypothetical protein